MLAFYMYLMPGSGFVCVCVCEGERERERERERQRQREIESQEHSRALLSAMLDSLHFAGLGEASPIILTSQARL